MTYRSTQFFKDDIGVGLIDFMLDQVQVGFDREMRVLDRLQLPGISYVNYYLDC
jgi:hypothetical protein